jgi:hypothetical protein
MVQDRKLVFAIVALALCAFGQRKPAAPEDLWLWRTASAPQVSPDSKWVAYVEEWNDRETGSTPRQHLAGFRQRPRPLCVHSRPVARQLAAVVARRQPPGLDLRPRIETADLCAALELRPRSATHDRGAGGP